MYMLQTIFLKSDALMVGIEQQTTDFTPLQSQDLEG